MRYKDYLENLTDLEKISLQNKLNVIKKLDYELHEINIYINSEIELNTRTISCRKEPEIIRWIEGNFKKIENPVFYDIGANIGAYSLVASKYCDQKIKTYSFEPSFLNFYQLNRNILLNECEESIIPLCLALSSENKLGNFNFSDLNTGSAAHAFGEAIGETGEKFKPEKISQMQCFKLDDLIEICNFEKPNFMKIDVDGLEMEIIKGSEKILSSDSFKSIVVEIVYEKDAEEFTNFLSQFGFKFESKHPYTGKSPGFNFIYSK